MTFSGASAKSGAPFFSHSLEKEKLSSLWEEESVDAHRWGRNSPLGIVKIGMALRTERAPTTDSFLCQ